MESGASTEKSLCPVATCLTTEGFRTFVLEDDLREWGSVRILEARDPMENLATTEDLEKPTVVQTQTQEPHLRGDLPASQLPFQSPCQALP